ncbi:MAG: DUF362 domain-containing protein [Deltaproteobacteria bacterium]|nr:DUF362 domain-containing protein [Candidatus Anaeroferrophillus wilburensis]MBN2888134.1 DUF362 domain-containing protein [Deltaproteobacteria bacterium]
MAATVYIADLRTTVRENLFAKIRRLLEKLELASSVKKNTMTAVKIHFGEEGNAAFIRPIFVRPVVEMVRELGGKPFVTDSNTLYVGSRSDAVSHLQTAARHGFTPTVLDAPVIIADGLRGNSAATVAIGQRHCKTAKIALEIAHAEAMVVMSHFKGHELPGFGGALKNLGMGCSSREGKLQQHSNISPKVARRKCVGCGECVRFCPAAAISLSDDKAGIDPARCIGCGECIVVCPQQAIAIRWNETIPVFQEKMVEYAYAACEGKRDKVLFLNFVIQVSPACDCYAHNDQPIVPDIGILASRDPVALDQACADLVNEAPGMQGSALGEHTAAGTDKFKVLYPEVDWQAQLQYAETIGLGTRAYVLERL